MKAKFKVSKVKEIIKEEIEKFLKEEEDSFMNLSSYFVSKISQSPEFNTWRNNVFAKNSYEKRQTLVEIFVKLVKYFEISYEEALTELQNKFAIENNEEDDKNGQDQV